MKYEFDEKAIVCPGCEMDIKVVYRFYYMAKKSVEYFKQRCNEDTDQCHPLEVVSVEINTAKIDHTELNTMAIEIEHVDIPIESIKQELDEEEDVAMIEVDTQQDKPIVIKKEEHKEVCPEKPIEHPPKKVEVPEKKLVRKKSITDIISSSIINIDDLIIRNQEILQGSVIQQPTSSGSSQTDFSNCCKRCGDRFSHGQSDDPCEKGKCKLYGLGFLIHFDVVNKNLLQCKTCGTQFGKFDSLSTLFKSHFELCPLLFASTTNYSKSITYILLNQLLTVIS